MLNRPTAWATLLLVTTFAAGIVVGVGGRALWGRVAYGGAPERGRGVEPLVAELTDELALTPVQRDSVHAILQRHLDRKSTRLNSSHSSISYAVFCLKKKKNNN